MNEKRTLMMKPAKQRCRSARRGAALTWVVAAVVLLCVMGAGLRYWQHSLRSRPRKVQLVGPAVAIGLGKSVKLELVRINPGTFMMGSPDDDPDHDISEGPVHSVTISKPFYMGKFEITQAQWGVIRGNQSSSNVGDEFPADGVSWGDATNWCKEMSTKLGVVIRLPTEAEWEYACRAGASTRFAFGTHLTARQANLNTGDPKSTVGKTTKVGSYKPNAFGLYDMHGNVWEWCQDTLHDDYEKAPADGSAWVDLANQFNRARRGGSWNDPASACRSAVRWGSPGSEKEPDMRNEQVGFRVVVETTSAK